MTTIRLQNTKTRKREDFVPIDPKNVRMYVCGPTVYDRAHIGNARPVIVFDVLYRLLCHVYGAEHVTYVRNFTDVDDKINKKAQDTGRTIKEITDETTQWYLDDMRAVGAMDPNFMPRATQYIPQMVTMIEDLITKGFAYPDGAGHVLFSVNSYPKYGALSGRSTDDMIAGARVEIADNKRDPMDFVLWKPSDGDQPGWESPWGHGRPGWHIECSAMAEDLLWQKPLKEGKLSQEALEHPHAFDIHGGGNDLTFPHHENEIAQSCCASGHAEDGEGFANYWLHNEMLQVEGKKMSKSLGNFFTVRDLLDQGIPGEVIRFVFLQTHYRKPMDWTAEKAKEAETKLVEYDVIITGAEATKVPEVIVEALANDLNTSLALTEIHKLFKEKRAGELRASLEFLGFDMDEFNCESGWVDRDEVKFKGLEIKLLRLREIALETKDFEAVDTMKSSLLEAGVEVRMSKTGVELEARPDFDASKLEGLL